MTGAIGTNERVTLDTLSEHVAEIRTDLAVFSSIQAGIQRALDEIVAAIKGITSDQVKAGKFPVALVLTFVGISIPLLGSVIGILWMGMNMTIGGAMDTVSARLSVIESTLASTTTQAKENRDNIVEIKQRQTANTAALIEVETQFNCHNKGVADLIAHQDQINALLAMGALKLTPGMTWPSLNFFGSCTPPAK